VLGEELENPDPGRVAQGLEELGLGLVERHTHVSTTRIPSSPDLTDSHDDYIN
jgi:hypothetical protein